MVNHGLSVLGRFEIPAGASRLVTQRGDVSVTLWVECGAVQLAHEGRQGPELAGGPIVLDCGPVVLSNAGGQPALVFAAIYASADHDGAAPAKRASFMASTEHFEMAAVRSAAFLPPADLEAVRSRQYVAVCVGDEHWSSGRLSYSAATAAGDHHKRDTGHEYNLESL
jgi:hypothetical protein